MNDSEQWLDVYIGLGSNLDDPARQILSAVEEIAALSDVEKIASSPLYASQPLGPQDQPDYVNAVLRIKTRLPAMILLRQLQQIEAKHGRVRVQRWGARTLDLDILLYGDQIIDEPELIVPHVELANRAFVLYPLADIADSTLSIPGQSSLPALLMACPSDGLLRLNG